MITEATYQTAINVQPGRCATLTSAFSDHAPARRGKDSLLCIRAQTSEYPRPAFTLLIEASAGHDCVLRPLHSSENSPLDDVLIKTGLFSSRLMRPACRIAVVSMVLAMVGSP